MGLPMTKTVAMTLGLLATLCLAGCYNTNSVKTGGLVCGVDDACPDGFACIKDSADGLRGHCWRKGTGPDAGGSAPDSQAPRSDAAGPLACTTADPNGRFGPFAGCLEVLPNSSSNCDPVCQSGCPCDRRCVIDTDTYGRFLCEGTAQPVSSFVPVQGTCTGSASESCGPGSVCVSDDLCPWLCFKTCRADKDCPADSRCSEIGLVDEQSKSVPNVRLCTPPREACNPTGTASCATPRANFNCVFLAGMTGVATTDETVCDCKTTHYKGLGTACQATPDDCQPGLVCVDRVCRQICERKAPACSSGGACSPIYGSSQYGYCR
jgi:hypothetical protein